MLNEAEFKACTFAVIEDIRSEMVHIAFKIFEEDRVKEAVVRGDSGALVDALKYSLARWVPDKQKVLILVFSQVFGEVAMKQYELLKNKIMEGEK